MTPNGEHQIIGPDRSQMFDAGINFLSLRHQCENPYCCLCFGRLSLRVAPCKSCHSLCVSPQNNRHAAASEGHQSEREGSLRPRSRDQIWNSVLQMAGDLAERFEKMRLWIKAPVLLILFKGSDHARSKILWTP